MSTHDNDCCCHQCLSAMADAFDLIEKMALAFQIQASWHGWRLEDPPQWAGHVSTLPAVPWLDWCAWFAEQAGERAMILDRVAAVLEAQELIRGNSC